jgi:hypothetical protein
MVLKIVAFKGKLKQFSNMLAAHIEDIRHPTICLLDTLFRVSVPLKLQRQKEVHKAIFNNKIIIGSLFFLWFLR